MSRVSHAFRVTETYSSTYYYLVQLRNPEHHIALSFPQPQISFHNSSMPIQISAMYRPLYCSAGIPTVLSLVFTFIFPVAQHSRQSLPVLPSALCMLWLTSAFSSPSTATVDPRYVNVFTILHAFPCGWISVSGCSLQPTYSVFSPLIFNPRSSIAHLHYSSVLSALF